ncbi:MAG: single-stranded-DNA-specific exonuclease RecJ [Cucumibacter sp.]
MSKPARLFLGVEKSVTGRQWVDRLDEAGLRTAAAIEQQAEVSEILARIMAGRGVAIEEAKSYLAPTLRELMPDPATLAGMDAMVARLVEAVRKKEKVALFGDYDVDGACASALMARYLRGAGLEPSIYIPDRVFEGYGPNVAAMDTLIAGGATLIVTLDCGTTSRGPIAHAKSRGVDVLVIDHHLTEGELPPGDAIVNPNRADDISGLGHLCAAGVTFMVLVALNRALRDQNLAAGAPDLLGLVDLVALATVCDVVPLKGLNRAFVLRGLEIMRKGANPGISALALAARVSGPLNTYHLGYLVGPRINAGGRIGNAALGSRLLVSTDEHETLHIAAELDRLNDERRVIEKLALEEALATAEAEIGEGEGPPVIVTASPNWHQGVVGLVAARLRERFDRPAFAISQTPAGGGTGSGRSIPGVDLGAAVLAAVAAGVIEKGGGHAMAAGVTLAPGQLADFRAFLAERLAAQVAAAMENHAVRIDAAIAARAASPAFLHEIERAGPFGAGNSNPVFALPSHRVTYAEVVGAGGHVRAKLAAGDRGSVRAIAFRSVGTPLGRALLEARGEAPLHFAGTLALNHWQGREDVQFRILDLATPAP